MGVGMSELLCPKCGVLVWSTEWDDTELTHEQVEGLLAVEQESFGCAVRVLRIQTDELSGLVGLVFDKRMTRLEAKISKGRDRVLKRMGLIP